MKYACMLMLCFLAGCAGQLSLEQLEAEAARTGDWSEVEKREALIAKRKEREGPDCAEGLTKACYNHMSGDRCECVSPRSVGGILMRKAD